MFELIHSEQGHTHDDENSGHQGCQCPLCQSGSGHENDYVVLEGGGGTITPSSIGLNNAAELIHGFEWGAGGGTAANVTYSFLNNLPSYYGADFTEQNNFSTFSVEMENAARLALQSVSTFANITFTEVAGVGDITFGQAALTTPESDPLAWAYYPDQSDFSGDIWFNNKFAFSSVMDVGMQGYWVMQHEIGHALGLQHSFTAGLTGAENTEKFTVMAYDTSPWFSIYSSSYMLYDIAALQQIYGANTSYNDGDTTYTLDPNAALTIWDGGGEDLFDSSAVSDDVIIYLEEGAFSSVGLEENIAVAYGAVIENATAGAGDDLIYGNVANNILNGGVGKDVLYGLDGDDVLHGGEGNDLLYGGEDNDTFYGGLGADTIVGSRGDDTVIYEDVYINYEIENLQVGSSVFVRVTSSADGIDTLFDIEKIIFTDGFYEDNLFTLHNTVPIAQDDAFVGDENVAITGNVLADNGNGADSDPDGDVLSVLAVTDLATAQGGTVTLDALGSLIYIPATDFVGEDSFDYMVEDGQGGSDIGTVNLTINENEVIDNSGDDIFVATSAAEIFDGGDGIDTVDYRNATERVSVVLSLTSIGGGGAAGDSYISIENIVGSDGPHQDALQGNDGDNVIHGLGGQDFIWGWAGNDILHGGGFNDILLGGDGEDTAVYSGVYANYTLSDNGNNFTITDNVGSEGTDTLYDIESFEFLDGVYANGVFTPNGETPPNAAPIAQDDMFEGDQDTLITGNVLADNGNGADSDPDGDVLNVVAVTALATVQGGTVDLTSDGTLTYTPATGFIGEDSFDYTLEDTRGGSDIGTVQIIVNEKQIDDGSDDSIFIATDEAEVFEGADDIDTVDYSNSTARVSVSLLGGGNLGYAAGDTYISIENIIGSDGPHFDALQGDTGANVISGLGGNDTIWSWGGDDTLIGGDESDILLGGDGEDTAVYSGVYANYTLSDNGNNFTITDNVGSEGTDTLYDIETFEFFDGGYTNGVFTPNGETPVNTAPIAQDDMFTVKQDITLIGNVLSDHGNGADSDPDGDDLNVVAVTALATLQGGTVSLTSDGTLTYTPATGFVGEDSFDYTLEDGRGGSDIGTVQINVGEEQPGGSDDDIFIATLAAEVFDGGASGIDAVDYSNSTARVVIDLSVNSASGGYAEGDSFTSIENIIGSEEHHFDILQGDDERNVIKGLSGLDHIYGRGGNDTLYGGDFLDVLIAGAGDDTLYGDAGDDILYGGTGADTFVFGADYDSNGVDVLKDFSVAEGDIIDVSNILEIYDSTTGLINNYVQITDDGADSVLSVDVYGGDIGFIQIATIEGVTGLDDVTTLVSNGTLVV